MVLDEPKDNDAQVEIEGLTYLIDKGLSERAGTVKVDFVDNGWQQGFTLASEKPLSSGAMSCGDGSCSC